MSDRLFIYSCNKKLANKRRFLLLWERAGWDVLEIKPTTPERLNKIISYLNTCYGNITFYTNVITDIQLVDTVIQIKGKHLVINGNIEVINKRISLLYLGQRIFYESWSWIVEEYFNSDWVSKIRNKQKVHSTC